MQEFARKLNLLDDTLNYRYWTPVVEVWNQVKPPSSHDAENSSAIIISKTTSLKCLTALAAVVASLKETTTTMNELNKNNVIGYLRLNLPTICFRGDNYSANFLECLEHNVNKILKDNSANSKKDNLIEVEKKFMLKEVFGSKNPSTSEIKKMKVDKLLKLAQYLDYSLPSLIQKQDVKEAREYIVKNVWRLQGLWDDVKAAISLAQRAFSSRI